MCRVTRKIQEAIDVLNEPVSINTNQYEVCVAKIEIAKAKLEKLIVLIHDEELAQDRYDSFEPALIRRTAGDNGVEGGYQPLKPNILNLTPPGDE